MVLSTHGSWPNMKFGVITMIDIRPTVLFSVTPRPSIQGDSRGEEHILEGVSNGHCEKKKSSYICV
jgi:hypothetical protein